MSRRWCSSSSDDSPPEDEDDRPGEAERFCEGDEGDGNGGSATPHYRQRSARARGRTFDLDALFDFSVRRLVSS